MTVLKTLQLSVAIAATLAAAAASVEPVLAALPLPCGSPIHSTSTVSTSTAPIRAGSYVWFTSVITVNNAGPQTPVIRFTNATIRFGGALHTLPSSYLACDGAITSAYNYTAYDNGFYTCLHAPTAGNVFLTGFAYRVPATLPTGLGPVTMAGYFSSASPGSSFHWQFAAAVYRILSTNYGSGATLNALGIKPVDDSTTSQYRNADLAGTPENYTAYAVGGVTIGSGGSGSTGAYSSAVAVQLTCP